MNAHSNRIRNEVPHPSLARAARGTSLTARLVRVLAANPEGLTREELVERLYGRSNGSSNQLRASRDACLRKLVQRARPLAKARGALILFHYDKRCWRLVGALTRV